MRILLAQNSLYYPSHGGGDKSNRLLLEALAGRGHTCLAVARISSFGEREHEEFLTGLAGRSVHVESSESGVVVFRHQGVEVHVVTSQPNLRAYLAGQIAAFRPDVTLTSTDDPAQLLLEAALKDGAARVVYLARATLALPFGPDCAFPSEFHTAALRRVDGAVGVSQYVADYIRKWSGIPAVHVPISLLESGPIPDLGRFDGEFVTMVNPCAVKGLSIFLELAGRMPQVRFAAVPTWGTSQEDRAALANHPNIQVLQPEDDIDRILSRTRVLLVPSLWAEARSRIVVEAMLRGVPVIASNVGGIPEAKMGVDYLLPVRSIEKYRAHVDERMVPIAEVPEQDIEPWLHALDSLLSDRDNYQRVSKSSRETALAYASNLNAGAFEKLLEEVVRSPRAPRPDADSGRLDAIESLTPEKRKLLALRLRRRNATRWFPAAETADHGSLRLFCFPHAGGGAAAFAGWAAQLPSHVSLVPARLPGRENRINEEPIRTMSALVETLAEALLPWAGHPFALLGHSMGAVVAFELTRFLRSHGLPMPRALFVSGARAPRFRLGWTPPPEPTPEQFIAELRRLEGVPPEVFANDELMHLILPALRADTSLYRNYVYADGSPVDCAIRAYGGDADPNVTTEHLDAWATHTTCSFVRRVLPGGHFFIQTAQERFLETLSRDLDAMV